MKQTFLIISILEEFKNNALTLQGYFPSLKIDFNKVPIFKINTDELKS